MTSPRFVVIEKDPVIALDMEEGLRSACGGCTVMTVRDMAEAIALPPRAAGHSVFITSARLSVIDESGLAAHAADQGDMIVVRQGSDADHAVAARGYVLLSAPFTDADLVALAMRMQPTT